MLLVFKLKFKLFLFFSFLVGWSFFGWLVAWLVGVGIWFCFGGFGGLGQAIGCCFVVFC